MAVQFTGPQRLPVIFVFLSSSRIGSRTRRVSRPLRLALIQFRLPAPVPSDSHNCAGWTLSSLISSSTCVIGQRGAVENQGSLGPTLRSLFISNDYYCKCNDYSSSVGVSPKEQDSAGRLGTRCPLLCNEYHTQTHSHPPKPAPYINSLPNNLQIAADLIKRLYV